MLSKLAENITAMLAYWDNKLICRFANQAYVDWFGVKPDEMIGKMRMEVLLGPLFEMNLPYIQNALKGEIQIFERAILTPRGDLRHTLATYTPDIVEGIVRGFYVHVADITPLKTSSLSVSTRNERTGGVSVYPDAETLLEVEKTLRGSVFSEFPGIGMLSQKHFISETKLKRDFKLRFNKTPFSYYRDLQMELAEIYIKQKRYNKKQLAAIFKFSKPSNFSTCYNKYLKQRQARFS